MKPLRILQLFSSFAIEGPLGGVARFVIDLSRNFDRTEVTPICAALWNYQTPFDDYWQKQVEASGIETIIASTWNEQRAYQSCLAALNGFWNCNLQPVDIIHSHGEFSDLAAILLRNRLGAKRIVRTVHNEREWAKRRLYGLIFPNLLYVGAFDLELGVSQQVVNNLNARLLARWRSPARVAYNAINPERFHKLASNRAHQRQLWNIPLEAKVIGSVGRLVPQKGYALLLEAFAQLLKSESNAYLLLVGDGYLREDLQLLANSLQISERVVFTGSQSNVEKLYPMMDVFVSSSYWEGLPTVIMESMVAGIPVIATKVSGSMELIEDGVTGLLVSAGDSNQICQSISHLLNDTELGASLSVAAKQKVEANFSIYSVAQRCTHYYQELL